MNTKKLLISALICGSVVAPEVFGQGFMNLDFEMAASTLPPGTLPGPVPAAQAFFGWQVYYGSSLQPVAAYNTVFLGAAGVSLIDQGAGVGYIEGNYAASLQAGIDPATGNPGDRITVSLAQTGQIPLSARFVQMTVSGPSRSDFQVMLGGNTITMLPITTLPSYTVYAGDVTAYASQIAELRITALDAAQINSWFVDSVRFGASVPEPNSGLLLVGGVVILSIFLGLRRRRLQS